MLKTLYHQKICPKIYDVYFQSCSANLVVQDSVLNVAGFHCYMHQIFYIKLQNTDICSRQ